MAVLVAPAAYADSYDAKISALNGEISQQQQVAGVAHAKADTIGGQVAELNAQIAAVQAQLKLNRIKQAQTSQRIDDARAELAGKKAILDESIRQIYQQSQVTPLEMLASSKNFSDYVDKQQYTDQIKDHIQDALRQINALKADLEKQQSDLNVQVSQQAGLTATLQQQQSQQSDLLAQAQGDESSANAAIQAKNGQVESLRKQQAAVLAAVSRSYSGGSIPGASGGAGGACDNGHGNGGYPSNWCNAPQDAFADSWGGYVRECVSWAAWRRSNIGRPIQGGWGNANLWAGRARAAGYRVDGSPEVGAVAQTSAGPYGHVAIVEAVQGGTVIVSEMNYDNDGHYRMGSYSASYFNYIH